MEIIVKRNVVKITAINNIQSLSTTNGTPHGAGKDGSVSAGSHSSFKRTN
jgi:hypothetical protein